MSRTVMPPAYKLITTSDRPPRRRAFVGSMTGVNVPARSRGTRTSIGPTSVCTVFGVCPLREFPEPLPAGSCLP
jgi:hypothetical protein